MSVIGYLIFSTFRAPLVKKLATLMMTAASIAQPSDSIAKPSDVKPSMLKMSAPRKPLSHATKSSRAPLITKDQAEGDYVKREGDDLDNRSDDRVHNSKNSTDHQE